MPMVMHGRRHAPRVVPGRYHSVMLRPSPSLPLETIAGLIAWLAAVSPLLVDVLSGRTVASAWQLAIVGVAWTLFGAGFAAVASWRLAKRSYLFHRVHLALLTLLAMTVVAAVPGYGTPAILFILTAIVAAHVLPGGWAAPWLILQSAWVGLVAAYGGAGASPAILQGGAYLSFMAFAHLMTRAGLREADARAELSRRNAELRATRRLLAEHERVGERLRISRDLHDLLGHRLTALILNLDVAGRTEGDASREALARADGLARSLLDAVREAVRTVRADDALDVASALRSMVEDVPDPDVRLRLPEHLELADPRAAHALLSCLQEVVTNAVRHADARHLWIDVRQDHDGVTLDARDDGRGANGRPEAGTGLRGMRERFEALGGRIEVTRAARPGFAVRAFLPARVGPGGPP